jgi:hypothetical protein
MKTLKASLEEDEAGMQRQRLSGLAVDAAGEPAEPT